MEREGHDRSVADLGQEAPSLVEALSALAIEVGRARTIDQVLDTAGRGVLGLGMRLGAVQLVDDALVLRYVASPSDRQTAFEAAFGRPIVGMSAPLDRVPALREAIDSPDPVYREEIGPLAQAFFGAALGLDDGTASAPWTVGWRGVLVPLHVRGSRWGLLAVASPALGPDDVAAASLFGAQVASALEVAESMEALASANRTLGTLVADRARESALVLGLSEIAARVQRERTVPAILAVATEGLATLGIRLLVMRIEDGIVRVRHLGAPAEVRESLERIFGLRLDDVALPLDRLEVLPELIERRRSAHRDDIGAVMAHVLAKVGFDETRLAQAIDVAGGRRGVVAPLFAHERAWGAMTALSDTLRPGDAAAVMLFATQMGSAIEVAESLETMARQNDELRALGAEHARETTFVTGLSEIAARVQSARTSSDVIATAAKGIVGLGIGFAAIEVRGDRVVFREALFDDGTSATFAGREIRGFEFPLPGSAILESVLAAGRPIYRRDLRALGDAFYERLGIVPDRPSPDRGLLAPLSVRGRPWGVLFFAAGSLEPTDAAPVTLFAAQVASALEVAETLEEAERRHRELAAIGTVARAAGEPDLDRVLPRILVAATAATASERAAIRFVGEDGRLTFSPGRAAPEPPLADLPDSPAAQRLHLGAWHVAVVPMHIKGRLVGTVDLARRGTPFDDEELQSAERVAAQVAVQVENARLYGEARRRVRLLSALLVLARVGSEAVEVAPLAGRVLDLLSETIPVGVSVLHVLAENRLRLVGIRGAERDARIEEALREIPLEGDFFSSFAVRERRTVLGSPDHWPDAIGGWARQRAFRHVVSTPLLVQDRVIGSLCVGRTEDTPFLDEEVHLLESCAAQVAVALDHARLFEEERRRVEDLSRINEFASVLSTKIDLSARLEAGVHQLARLAEVPNAFIMLLDPDGRRLRGAATTVPDVDPTELVIPIDAPSAAKSALETGTPVVIEDVDVDPRASKGLAARFGNKAVFALPLVARGQAVGAVVLGDPRPGRRFTAAVVDRTQAVANQLAVAIENARLLADARRRVEELRLLVDVGRVITGSLDLEQILEASAGALRRMIDASNTFILLLDAPVRELRGVATSSPEYREHFRTVRIPVDEPSIAAKAVRARAPQVVSDTGASADVYRPLVSLYGEKSLLALPLLLRDEPIGAVVIDDTRGAREWTDAEIELATLIAQQVAIAVANARLFEDLRRSYGDLARAQEELVKRERLAALGELAAVVAHEVRNPLGVIFNSIVSLRKILARRTPPAGDDAAMLLSIVGEEADRLNRTVGDLLDFARPHDPSIQSESLKDVLQEALAVALSEPAAASIDVRLEIAPDMPEVGLDARLMRQALLNVLLNGLQAMPRGGTLTVRAATERRADRSFARVDVTDTGPGIPLDLQPRIFQPFFTTKASGTGLGLAVVKRIVDAHRGEVAVDSRPGAGTTFILRLPLEEART